ncbi:MAG: benzoate-CoA ligase family protein [Alphaproteobacteria bacterium]|nr:benzoate-CoA ligase family protein [Alphaproteobacteria bacterium]
MSFVQRLDDLIQQGGGARTALITQQDARWRYTDLHRAVQQAAAGLRALGVRRGERVMLVLDNTPAFYAAMLGAMRLGAVPMPVNFLSRAEDFGFFLDDAYATAAVVDAGFLGKLGPVLSARPAVRAVVANGEAPAGTTSLDAWLAGPAVDVPAVDTHPDDPAFWLYSSGSTGRPKGVVHRHAAIEASVTRYAKGVLGITADDVFFSTTPLFHAYGLGNGLWFPLSVGATVVLSTGRPTPEAILERVASHRPTLYFSVPALYAALLTTPATGAVDWSAVRHGVSAAESLPGEVARRFKATTGVEILDGIGSTEMLHIYCSNRPGAVEWDSSGTPVDGYDLQLRDPDGQPAAPGEAGELWVRGPSMLVQYWHRVDRSRAKIQGAWFATGDRYRRSASGAYAYEGRVDDMMKIGGLWVSPIDIESRLIEHDAVHEAAVVGVNVAHRSRIAAWVILAKGHDASDALVAELQAWCKAKLLRYQFPHVVHFVEDLPRTATGKIQRFKLRQG